MSGSDNTGASLADKIAGILSAAPSFDPEDNAVDATTAQVLPNEAEEFGEESVKVLSSIRKQNLVSLADVDERYAGKKVLRKNLLFDAGDSSAEDEEVSDGSEDSTEKFGKFGLGSNSDGDDVEDEEDDVEDEEDDVEEEEDDVEEEEDDVEDEEDDVEDEEEGEEFSEDKEEGESGFKSMKETNVSQQIKKGICVRNQLTNWESLLEMRIQLQKCLVASNKMPQKETFAEMKKSDTEFSNKVNTTKNNICKTLDKMLELQNLLLKKYPETKNLGKDGAAEKVESDDEEIPSDTEPENSESESEVEGSQPEQPTKKRKLNDYENSISQCHNQYKTYRDGVIQKWNDKTRIAVLKSGTASHSVLNQIEYALSNKEKLVKRTQLRRSQYKILGEVDSEDNEDKGPKNEYNTEIFDDDDFYHQLLRELIEMKSAGITDPVQLGRQWIQLQNMRSKMKRKIDTRATKGRKIRYAVHSKLVNFMTPIEENIWIEESTNVLFKTLFNKSKS